MSARLHARYDDEVEFIGPFVHGRGVDYLERPQTGRRNREGRSRIQAACASEIFGLFTIFWKRMQTTSSSIRPTHLAVTHRSVTEAEDAWHYPNKPRSPPRESLAVSGHCTLGKPKLPRPVRGWFALNNIVAGTPPRLGAPSSEQT